MFPLINKQPLRTVTVPDLAGGVNMRDGLTDVADNQLVECENMWFKGGVLQTRCGLNVGENGIFELGQATDSEYTVRLFENIKNTADGRDYILSAVEQHSKWYKDEELCESTTIYFNWVGETGTKEIGNAGKGVLTVNKNVTYFVTLYGSVLHCVLSDYGIYFNNLKEPDSGWVRAAIGTPYVPKVFTHCRPSVASGLSAEYTQFEGFNLFSTKYRIVFSTVNPELESNEMRYELPVMLPGEGYTENFAEYEKIFGYGMDALYVNAHHTFATSDGKTKTVTHSVKWPFRNTTAVETTTLEDGLTMYVNPQAVMFRTSPSQSVNATVTKEKHIEDNLEIEAIWAPTSAALDKVFSMTRAEWFGGASSGIRGGTRLMLCGNAKEGEKNLVMYSDLNRPLYFSENSYFYVGDSTSAVTGFGKQSDMLVIFKENETYFTRYNQREILSEDLINQKVIDYTASSVYFPLTLIHSSIGCDLPDTVQLCRNRLVWATRSGGIYTLTSDNQYSERNIYEVGEMIKRALPTRLPESASACDRNGYYVLLCGDKAYLMDYNSSGYQYIYSYQKNEGANIKIPWYCWKFDYAENPLSLLTPKIGTVGGALTVAGVYDGVKTALVAFTLKDRDTDTRIEEGETALLRCEVPISCGFTTKLFDFGAANYRKNVDSVGLSLGANGGVPIAITFITDCGENGETVALYSDETEDYTAGHIQSVIFNPCVRGAIRFGIKAECEGNMSVDGVTINYRLTGPAR